MEIIFILVGLLFTCIGFFFFYDTYSFRQIARQTQGKVIGYESHISKSSKGGSTTMYSPVVEFDNKGETICFKASFSTGNTPYKIGQQVPVLYQWDDPHGARIRTNLRYIMATIFTALGLITLGVGLTTFKVNPFSLAIAAFILLSLTYKAFKLKTKLNNQGIHSIDDIKKMAKAKQQPSTASELFTEASNSKNYQPSKDFIRSNEAAKKAQQTPKWLGPVFIVIALGMCIGGGYLIKERAEFLDRALSTEGRIVDRKTNHSSDSTTYSPVIGFEHLDSGREIRFTHEGGSSHPSWSIGNTVTVLYNPDDPSDALMDDGWMNWMGPGILSAMGAILLLAGISMTRRQQKLRT